MPYAIPAENVIGAAQAAIETDTVRQMVENYTAEKIDISDVVLPDYAGLEKPLIIPSREELVKEIKNAIDFMNKEG